MQYFVDRLKEPGTLRSLAVVLFALWGLAPDDPRIEAAIQVAILLLGGVSALIPEKTTAAAQAVQQATQQAQAATAQADTAVRRAANIVEAARDVISGQQPDGLGDRGA